ncbi:MAG: hypothetical protein RR626_02290 [Anaerovoracaceae bacterium]
MSVITVSAFSFAAWDTLTASDVDNTVKLRTPVTVSLKDASFSTTGADGFLTESPAASADVDFTISDSQKVAKTLTLTTVIKDGASDVTAEYDVTYAKKNDGTSADITGGVATIAEGKTYDYVVKITPKDNGTTTKTLDKDLKVEVTGTLSK